VIGLSRIPGAENQFELVHPRCVEETEPDFEEGIELRREGDPEAARDALRFVLEACHDNLWVHVALGRIALEDFQDPQLARGHFGYAVELARKALPMGFKGHLPRGRPANRPFFDALDGLARSFRALGKARDAEAIESQMRVLAGA
jgi:hypothetical protein